MKFAAFILTFGFCVWASGSASAGAAEDQSLFSTLEKALMDGVASRDREAMERLLGESYKLTSSDSNGAVLNKTQYIAGSMSPGTLDVKNQSFKEIHTDRLTEDVVIVRAIYYFDSIYRGKPWRADFLMTDVWQKTDQGWQLVSRHSSYPANELRRIVQERYAQ